MGELTIKEAKEKAARAMFFQHHGKATAKARPWESVGEREHVYWLTKAEIGVRLGMAVTQK